MGPFEARRAVFGDGSLVKPRQRLESYLVPTYPSFDPANLPPYPEKPHKTGQARVNVDGKSQYLGKYGTVESHALYHMACARKLITGVVPPTRELRDEISAVAGQDEPKRMTTASPLTVVGLIVLVAMTSGVLSHFITKASVRSMPSQQVVTHKPILPNNSLPNNDIGENGGGGDNLETHSFSALEKSVFDLEREHPDTFPITVVEKVKSALERIESHKSEGSQKHVDRIEESEDRKRT